MVYPQDWAAAEQKLRSLFPDQAVCGQISAKLLSNDEKRLRVFRDTDEAVRASLNMLLTPGGPLVCSRLDPGTQGSH